MRRDFTYKEHIITGVAEIIDRAPENSFNKYSSGTPPYKIYNIGNNSAVTLGAFTEAIEGACGRKAVKNLMPMQAGDVPATWADASLLRTLSFVELAEAAQPSASLP